VQLGFLPRLNIVQTSARAVGQIYIPAYNWFLLVMVLAAVLGFGSSSNLAQAYGVALTGTMLVTTILTFFVIRYAWGYPLWLCLAATGFFFAIDIAFFGSAMLKVPDGGWFPLAIGLGMFVVMTTWRRGRGVMFKRLDEASVPLEPFLASLFRDPPHRVAGTAIFLTATPDATPHALLHNLNHNKVLHERVVFLTVEMRDEPSVPEKERVVCQKLAHGCWRVRMSYGFMDRPDVTRALKLCAKSGIEFEMMETSFFLSRELIVPTERGVAGMALWRDRMFAAMARNAGNITDYFNIPTNRVIELGTRVQI
jgi:KUP system potassium uptake protein